MTKLLAVGCALLLSAGLGSAEPEPRTVADETGVEHAIPDPEVSVTVLYFWAVWCHPCEPVGKQMQKLYEKYADRGVRLLGVSYSDSDDPSGWAKQQGYGFPIVLPGYETALAYGVDKIPTVLVIDSGGNELLRQIGDRPGNEEALHQLIENRLGASKAESP